MTILYWILAVAIFGVSIVGVCKEMGNHSWKSVEAGEVVLGLVMGTLINLLLAFLFYGVFSLQHGCLAPYPDSIRLVQQKNLWYIGYQTPEWNPFVGEYRGFQTRGGWFLREEADLQYADFVRQNEKTVEAVK